MSDHGRCRVHGSILEPTKVPVACGLPVHDEVFEVPRAWWAHARGGLTLTSFLTATGSEYPLMRKTISISVLVFLFLALTPVVQAAKGEVVLKKSGCDYFLVLTNKGYALLEWYGGNDPSRGDILAGDYESFGMKDIYNLTDDHELRVWVEDFWLSKSRAIEKYYDKCH